MESKKEFPKEPRLGYYNGYGPGPMPFGPFSPPGPPRYPVGMYGPGGRYPYGMTAVSIIDSTTVWETVITKKSIKVRKTGKLLVKG